MINPGSQHSRITLEHPKTLPDKCHSHTSLPTSVSSQSRIHKKNIFQTGPPACTLLSTHRGHLWRAPTPVHLLLHLISVQGPCHLIPPFEWASLFWKQHLQALTSPSPHPPAAAEPSPQTQEYSAELTSPSQIVCRGHKLTALVWIPFLDMTLLVAFDFLCFFHFPSVT